MSPCSLLFHITVYPGKGKKKIQRKGKEAHSQFLLMDSFVFSALPMSIKRLKTEEQKTYPLIFSPHSLPHPLLLVVETITTCGRISNTNFLKVREKGNNISQGLLCFPNLKVEKIISADDSRDLVNIA